MPKQDLILQWATTDPTWHTGNWYIYTQYFDSKGVKIANYADSFDRANAQQALLESFTALPGDRVHFASNPREVSSKSVLRLKLKRIVYFESSPAKAGKQPGVVIFTSDRYDDA
jgi:hypothetical protein